MNPDKYLRIPLTELTNPNKKGPLMVYKDRWWRVDENGNALFYETVNSPQCNMHKEIVERVLPLPGTTIQFVPWVWVQFNIRDYT